MLISAYHKRDDYFAIPLKVYEINPEYKIYMRHYPYVPAWDTSFYFVKKTAVKTAVFLLFPEFLSVLSRGHTRAFFEKQIEIIICIKA